MVPLTPSAWLGRVLLFSCLTLVVTVGGVVVVGRQWIGEALNSSSESQQVGLANTGSGGQGQVLAAHVESPHIATELIFRIKTRFLALMQVDELEVTESLTVTGETVLGGLQVGGDVLLSEGLSVEGDAEFANGMQVTGGSIDADGIDVDLGAGTITAANIVYSLIAGNGISLAGTQTVTVTNADPGSAQKIFGIVKVGDVELTPGDNTDTLTLSAGSGVSLGTDADTDTVTVSAANQSGWYKPSSTVVALITNGDNVGLGLAAPTNKLEIDSGSTDTSGMTFTRLTSASSSGIGGGKVLSLDSGGRVILVNDQTGDTPTAESVLPDADTGSTLFFNGTNWVASTNLYHNGGTVGISTTSPAARFHSYTNAVGTIGAVIQGITDQTANLQEWRNGAGSILSYIDAAGVFNGSANVAGSIDPGLVEGQVAYQGADGLAGSNNLFWNNSTGNLGIGTTVPGAKLQVGDGTGSGTLLNVSGAGGSAVSLQIGSASGTSGNLILESQSNGGGNGVNIHSLRGNGPFNMGYRGASSNGTGGSMNIGFLHSTWGGDINFRQLNAVVATINSSGSVGIGTTTPLGKLHVEGAATGKALAILNETGNQDLLVASASGATKFKIGNTGNIETGSIITVGGATGNAGTLYFFNNGVRIERTGNSGLNFVTSGSAVGGGSTFTTGGAATSPLTVRGAAAQTAPLQEWHNSASTVLTVIDASGNIGVGTTTPLTKLHVSTGDILINHTQYLRGGLSASIGNSIELYNGSTGDMNFTTYDANKSYVFKAASAALVTIKGGGNVGIGTTSPTSKLHSYADVEGIGSLTSIYGRAIKSGASGQGGNTATAVSAVAEITGAGGLGNIIALESTIGTSNGGITGGAYGLKINNITNGSSFGIVNTYGIHIGDLSVGTQTNEPYSLYASDSNSRSYFAGNVGIGTTAPTALLHVGSGGSLTNVGASDVYFQNDLEVDGTTYLGTTQTGTLTSTTGTVTMGGGVFRMNSNGEYLYLQSQADDGIHFALGTNSFGNNSMVITTQANRSADHGHNTLQTNPKVFVHSATAPGTSNTEWGSLSFEGTGSGGGYFNLTTGVGHLALSPISGNVGIGTTSPGQALDVVGNARFSAVGSGTYASDLHLTADGTLTTAASDIRLKKDLVELNDGAVLGKLLQLKTYNFNWKSNNSEDIGMVAQEVATIFPDLTFTNQVDGYMGINYSRFSSLLVSAMQAQQTQIASLQDTYSLSNTGTLQLTNEATAAAQPAEETPNEQPWYTKLAEAITVIKETIFSKAVRFEALAEFFGKAKFKDGAVVEGELSLSANQTGSAEVPAGATRVEVKFSKSLTQTPLVIVTPNGFVTGQYKVASKTTDGFIIELSEPQTQAVAFDWQASVQTDSQAPSSVTVLESAAAQSEAEPEQSAQEELPAKELETEAEPIATQSAAQVAGSATESAELAE